MTDDQLLQAASLISSSRVLHRIAVNLGMTHVVDKQLAEEEDITKAANEMLRSWRETSPESKWRDLDDIKLGKKP